MALAMAPILRSAPLGGESHRAFMRLSRSAHTKKMATGIAHASRGHIRRFTRALNCTEALGLFSAPEGPRKRLAAERQFVERVGGRIDLVFVLPVRELSQFLFEGLIP